MRDGERRLQTHDPGTKKPQSALSRNVSHCRRYGRSPLANSSVPCENSIVAVVRHIQPVKVGGGNIAKVAPASVQRGIFKG